MTEKNIKYDTPIYEPSPAFFAGTATSGLTPWPFPISLGGHYYGIQWDKDSIGVWGAKFKRASLPLLRTQADNSNTPGEQSISPEQFWRRSQDTWQFGQGQIHLDRANSEIRRYNYSNGIDPWTPWQLKLLNDVTNVYSTTNTGLRCQTVGSYVYIVDGGTVKFSSSALSSWTTVAPSGSPASAVDFTTDGYNIWEARGTSGIYTSTIAGTTSASYATSSKTINLVRFCKSRLMAASSDGVLYNITKSGALSGSDILLDLTARNMKWVDIVGGQSQIYAAGYSGDKSYIYRTAILADGTALAVPTVAGQLPDGEIVRSLGEYMGYIFIGSDLGFRFCTVNSDGSLTIGALIKTPAPVYCFEGQDHYVWYGLSNYDENTGLGRIDPTNFNGTLIPAYSSDLMVRGTETTPVTGTVGSVGTFGSKRIFSVDGKGIYLEASVPVSSGYFVSGVISYGISDPKVAMYVDLKHEPLVGSVAVGIVADTDDTDIDIENANTIGISATAGSVSPDFAFPAGQLKGENFQIVLKLTSNGTNSPIVTRWTLRSYPTPVRTAQWDVPIMIYPTVTLGDKDWDQNSDVELDYLFGLHQSQEVVTLQVSDNSYQVVMYDYQWLPDAVDIHGKVRGIFYAQLREIVG